MNYFAHALPFLDRPYFAAGTGVPDWLTVVDRRVRVRPQHTRPFLKDDDPIVAAVAGGVLQHLQDDIRFHRTRAFAETMLQLAAAVRDVLGPDPGFRPTFLGHLLVEVLLDASLAAENPGRMEEYYRALESIEAGRVQLAINRMAPRPTNRLAPMISQFSRERILSDYLEDGKLLVRLDQVMRRVKLARLPRTFGKLLPDARRLVRDRMGQLLQEIPTDP